MGNRFGSAWLGVALEYVALKAAFCRTIILLQFYAAFVKINLQKENAAAFCSVITGTELKEWRKHKNLTQRELGDMLDISDAAINRWEGGQDISGPAQLLLGWLIDGKMPFGQEGEAAGRVASAAWKVEMTLEAFKKLESKALAEGFDDLVDYIGELVRRELASEPVPARNPENDIALLAEKPVGYVARRVKP